jgi:isoleucyl-tRNA synthetase
MEENLSGKNYKSTLNIVKTDFPMKGKLSEQQKRIITLWQDRKIYKKIFNSGGSKKYVLHWGPPYANGELHHGHYLNITTKDLLIRYKQSRGFKVEAEYVADCNGMPIEHGACKAVPKDMTIREKRDKCRKFSDYWAERHFQSIKKMGVLMDQHVYHRTSNYSKEIYENFNNFLAKGMVFNKRVPMLWSPREQSVVSKVDTEYKDVESLTVTLALPITIGKYSGKKIAIYTTTPWSLFGNAAVSFNSKFTYVLVDDVFYVKELAPKGKITLKIAGEEFNGSFCAHPITDEDVPLVDSDHTTNEMGTGFVHIAPAHGPEDFLLGEKYNLPIRDYIDDSGFIRWKDYEPISIKDNKKIFTFFEKKVIKSEKITHSCAFSSRGKCQLFYRTTLQTFIDIKNITPEILKKKFKDIPMYPEGMKDGFINLMSKRDHWCISRNRFWGVPMAIFMEKESGKILYDAKIQRKILAKMGSDPDFFFEKELVIKEFEKLVDWEKYDYICPVLDVWFDSGCVSQLPHLKKKPGLYLEGNDQTRGWFQTSTLVSHLQGLPLPFSQIVMHGFVTDEKGMKLSKSKGNAIKIDDKCSYELLRLWVMTADIFNSKIPLGPKIMENCGKYYRKLRNTMRFLISVLESNDRSKKQSLLPPQAAIMDFAYFKAQQIYLAMDNYSLRIAWDHLIELVNIISGNVFNVIKVSLYCWGEEDPEFGSILTMCEELIKLLLKLISFILPMTSEEIFQYLLEKDIKLSEFEGESVHLNKYKIPDPGAMYKEVIKALVVVEQVNKIISASAENKKVRHSLEYIVTVAEKSQQDVLTMLLPVSAVSLGAKFQVSLAEEASCERCRKVISDCSGIDILLCSKCRAVIDKQKHKNK